MGNPLVRFCEGPRRTEGMAENLGHRMEICGNSGRTIWPKAAVGLGLLDNNMVERILSISKINPPAQVLDIGCGLGYHAAAFA